MNLKLKDDRFVECGPSDFPLERKPVILCDRKNV